MWVLANRIDSVITLSIVNPSPVTAANPNGVGSSNYHSARDNSNYNDYIYDISAVEL